MIEREGDMAESVDDLNMLQRVQLLWSLLRDDRISIWLRRVGPMAILAYVISPIDLIPDFILGVGQVDDLGVVALGMFLLVRLITRFAPEVVVAEHVGRITGKPMWSAQGRHGPEDETIETTGRVHRR
jgi:uncharacterized membrane protein YkvA (DUF1232 family)